MYVIETSNLLSAAIDARPFGMADVLTRLVRQKFVGLSLVLISCFCILVSNSSKLS